MFSVNLRRGKLVNRCAWRAPRSSVVAATLAFFAVTSVNAESVNPSSKHIIGATATLVETSTGIPFSARIDTGAKSCSIHVEKIEIEDEQPSRVKNIGKKVRFLLDNTEGQKEWVEAKIEKAVRVKSSALKSGKFDRRYKVRLTLEWEGIRKEVLVTLNNRDDMEHPLLIGRNFLRGDFLVDVSKKATE